MAILVCHTIGRAVLNMRSACESCRMIKLTERVNDEPIRKNDTATKELVARKNDVAIKELVPLGDKIPASKIKQEEEKGLFNSAWKSAGPEETKKRLNST